MARHKSRTYAKTARNRIKGWISRVDAEIFSGIMLKQTELNISGGAMEIGIHHGKSFMPLLLCLAPGEVAIAIDLFDRQELNVTDPSGKGNLRAFKANIGRHGSEDQVRIIEGSSLDVTADQIKVLSPDLRFVSIDGGHWHDAVLNDLRLAASCAGTDCVIAIDDFFNPDYAEVMAAYFTWLNDDADFTPFAASQGKFYLCRPGRERVYQDALFNIGYLRSKCKKRSTYLGKELYIFTGLHSGALAGPKKFLEIHFPELYQKLKTMARPV